MTEFESHHEVTMLVNAFILTKPVQGLFLAVAKKLGINDIVYNASVNSKC